MARESPNLLRKLDDDNDQSYARRLWQELEDWLKELHEESRKDHGLILALPKDTPKKSNLCENRRFRIDCQDTFSVEGFPGISWYNVAVQENKTRPKGSSAASKSTTIMTTYVHKEGFWRQTDPVITSKVIFRRMWSQAMHAIPENTIFIRDEIADTGFDHYGRPTTGRLFQVETVQRSPHGILTYNATGPAYGILGA